MARHSLHALDPSSIDWTATHRLPAVSAADALEELDDTAWTHLSTGIDGLDRALGGPSLTSGCTGGFSRGQVAEIWGPPGVGKTGLGFSKVYESVKARRGSPPSPKADEANFAHFACPTLAHFVAILCRPQPSTLPPNTALVVIDSLSALINPAFPKLPDARKKPGSDKGQPQQPKRPQILQYITSALQKLTATRNCAAIILGQCATRMLQLERGAALIAAINASVWEQGISTRVVLFRDWAWQDGEPVAVRLAGLQKLDGKAQEDSIQRICAFNIDTHGLASAHYDANYPGVTVSTPRPRKRKLGYADLDEIPDSDDDEDEYGCWGDGEDAALPVMPPQWQGSEDVLLGRTSGSEHEEEAEEDETASPENQEPGLQETGNERIPARLPYVEDALRTGSSQVPPQMD